MERIFLSVVLLSAAAGILGLVLKGFFKLSKKRYRARSKCVIWISLLVFMALPFSVNIGRPLAAAALPSETTAQYQVTLLPGGTATPMDFSLPENSWVTVAALLWLGGVVLAIFIKLFCYVAYLNRLKQRSSVVQGERINEVLREASDRLGIRKDLRLYRSGDIQTPLLMGMLRPAIYLPEHDWAEEQQKMILQHELCHYKSHDLVIRLFLLAVTAMHWFNPVVYLVGRELKASLEEACDAAVLEQSSPETRRLYGKTVLETAYCQQEKLPLMTAPFAARHSRLKERCQRILTGDGALCRGRGLILGACSLVAALAVVCALVPKPQVAAGDSVEPSLSSQPTESTAAPVESDNWLFPLEGKLYVTAPYGEGNYTFHKGLDVSRDDIAGEEIHAARAGVVVTANTDAHSNGNYVVIDHGDGYQTLYAHCQSLAVTKGQRVAQGETIAYVGSTGNSTGPHLHFEIQKNGEPFDPAQIFPDLNAFS